MDKLERRGHRQRMRDAYLRGGADSMADHNMLELFLSLVIPQKDVKPLAYDLINTFGSLERVVSASPQRLMEVNGVGENTAILLNLVRDINTRIDLNRNKYIIKLGSVQQTIAYAENILKNSVNEKILLITLDNDLRVIKSNIVSEGVVNCANVEPKKIVECVIRDNASSVVLAHNHPGGKPSPSPADLSFTITIQDILKKINVKMLDHIIVGEGSSFAMNSDPRYMMYFE